MTDEELVEKCLLTYEEMGKVGFNMGSPFGVVDRDVVCVAVAKAQLTKAIPIIRKAVELDAYARGFEQAKFETRLAVEEERLNRPELREKIARVIMEYDGRGHPSEVRYGEVADQILAPIPTEELCSNCGAHKKNYKEMMHEDCGCKEGK